MAGRGFEAGVRSGAEKELERVGGRTHLEVVHRHGLVHQDGSDAERVVERRRRRRRSGRRRCGEEEVVV